MIKTTEFNRRWSWLTVFVVFSIYGVCSNDTVVSGARQCCPQGLYLTPYTFLCSDNRTRFALKCEDGAHLLDPAYDDYFWLEDGGKVIVFNGEKRTEDQFCLGKIQGNESWSGQPTVALVCFQSESASKETNVVSILLRLLMVISTLFLLCTLYVYLAVPNLRDLQGKCVMALICSLVSSYVTLLVIQTFPNSSKTTCVIQAAVLYFFMSASFFWNNVITFIIWKAIRKIPIKMTEKSWLIIYFCWGFGAPLIMVTVSFILENVPGGNHVRPSFAERNCWFKGKTETWNYFYGPVSVLLVLNTIMFLHSSWILWRNCRKSSVSSIKSLRFKCLMYLKLFLLMGITWIFEVISYATNEFNDFSKYLWVVTDGLNSSQGVFIFLVLVVCRQKARLGILKKKLLGISWPQSWAKEELQESSLTFYGENFELAKQKVRIIGDDQPD